MNPMEFTARLRADCILFVKDVIACGIQKAAMAQVVKSRHNQDYLAIFKKARAEVVDTMSDDDLWWTWDSVKADKLPVPSCIEPDVWDIFGKGSIVSELDVARHLCSVSANMGVVNVFGEMFGKLSGEE